MSFLDATPFRKDTAMAEGTKTMYLLTHGECVDGPNPAHTQDGHSHIIELAASLDDDESVKACISCIATGTGLRFLEIFRVFRSYFPHQRVAFSPFLGDASIMVDTSDAEPTVVLDAGGKRSMEVPFLEYYGLAGTPGFNPREFLSSNFPNGTVFCTGREFLRVLGHAEPKSGTIYRVTVDDTSSITQPEIRIEELELPSVSGPCC